MCGCENPSRTRQSRKATRASARKKAKSRTNTHITKKEGSFLSESLLEGNFHTPSSGLKPFLHAQPAGPYLSFTIIPHSHVLFPSYSLSCTQDERGNPAPGGFHAFNPQGDFLDNKETNVARPLTDAVITIRIIKSFEFRSMKAYVIKSIDLTTTTVAQLEELCRKEVTSNSAFRAFRSYAAQLDTLKLYTRAHGSKTTNLIINLDHPEWVLDDANLKGLLKDPSSAGESEKTKENTTLAEIGVENETELSFFNKQAYEAFLANPNTKWDATG